MQTRKKTCNAMIAVLLAIAISTGAYAATITVEAGGDIAAANATAVAGDVIDRLSQATAKVKQYVGANADMWEHDSRMER